MKWAFSRVRGAQTRTQRVRAGIRLEVRSSCVEKALLTIF